MNLLEIRTSQYMSKLSSNDLQSLKEINTHYTDIPNILMKDLAERCYISISTLHRIILKIGFNGFSDFKIRITDNLKAIEAAKESLFDEEKYLQNYLSNITLTKRLNEGEIKKVADVILEKKSRFCFGTGWKQKQVINNFSNDLLYYKESFITLRTENDLRLSTDTMDENSVLIILSLSGNTENYSEVLKTCKIRNVTIISITSDKINSLSSFADYSLYYKENVLDNIDKHWDIGTLNFLVNYLIEVIVHQKDKKI
ncbi:MAG: MurR/RpiR family transcriptional regulator [Tetragenococcus koreensis]|uniref:MurR/RpiR family transcriptional regulator n=1 Tax=Tetragenococcus halophilus TaxID=51669 RepID=A0AB35HLX3_TETHA|nr:MurR/RpiR family transcriptional regulator [Tetragenococcus halophilus]MCF1684656.1 MurR/RpiR family transcriptional regulator [Tetragenococcus halophilus]MCO8297092.1 MurR/RpiR family transcriptional regulator [Tetragenococcus halophilus]MDN6541723.1 MurR/RpiR family transcriptional regulator [Tetragenococcus koreensis]MDN6733011.1 MurR/RpiR family transcriptional regulator [Tetragenococcus koreensis]